MRSSFAGTRIGDNTHSKHYYMNVHNREFPRGQFADYFGNRFLERRRRRYLASFTSCLAIRVFRGLGSVDRMLRDKEQDQRAQFRNNKLYSEPSSHI